MSRVVRDSDRAEGSDQRPSTGKLGSAELNQRIHNTDMNLTGADARMHERYHAQHSRRRVLGRTGDERTDKNVF